MAGRIIVLDSAPLGLASMPRPRRLPEPDRDPDHCRAWLAALRQGGDRILIPAVADYEVRRELIRVGIRDGRIDAALLRRSGPAPDLSRASASIARLDALRTVGEFIPLDAEADLFRAAELWALLRNRGLPTSMDRALDADSLIIAQAARAADGRPFIVATSDVGDMGRFPRIGVALQAARWNEIPTSTGNSNGESAHPGPG